MTNYVEHTGTPRHSGRYPWGSGENPYHHGEAGLNFAEMKSRVKRDNVLEVTGVVHGSKNGVQDLLKLTKRGKYRLVEAKDENDSYRLLLVNNKNQRGVVNELLKNREYADVSINVHQLETPHDTVRDAILAVETLNKYKHMAKSSGVNPTDAKNKVKEYESIVEEKLNKANENAEFGKTANDITDAKAKMFQELSEQRAKNNPNRAPGFTYAEDPEFDEVYFRNHDLTLKIQDAKERGDNEAVKKYRNLKLALPIAATQSDGYYPRSSSYRKDFRENEDDLRYHREEIRDRWAARPGHRRRTVQHSMLFFEHAGQPRRSGRYKWGSGENPYHHGQAIPRGERRAARNVEKYKEQYKKNVASAEKTTNIISRGIADRRVNAAQKKYERSAKKLNTLKENRLNKKDRVAQTQEELNEVLRSGDPAKIYAYRKQLSNEQLSASVNRLNNEKKLKDLSAQDKKSFLDKVDAVSKKVETTGKIAKRFMSAYDAAAEVHNTFSKGNKWARVNKGQDNDQKKKDAKAATFSKYANNLVKKSSKRKTSSNGYDGPRLSDPYEDDKRNWR